MKSMKTLCRFSLLFFLLHSSFSLASDWPQYRCTPERTGYTPATLEHLICRMEWEYFFEDDRIGESAQPIVIDGHLFIGTKHGKIVALDVRTGAPAWNSETGAPVLHTLAGTGQGVVAAALDGFVYCFSRTDGVLLWKTDTGFGISSAPCVTGAKIFVANRGGDVVAIDAESGGISWRARCGGPVFHTPAFHDGLVFVGCEDMRVYSFDAATGAEAWRTDKLPGMSFEGRTPVVSQGMVLVRTMPFWIDQLPDNYSGYTPKRPFEQEVEAFGRGFPKYSMDTPQGVSYFDPDNKDSADQAWDVYKRLVTDPARLAEHQQYCRDFLENEKHALFRDCFIIDAKTGAIPRVCTIWFSCCSGGPCPEPVADSKGDLYTPSSLYGDSFHSILRASLVRLDLEQACAAEVVTVGGNVVNANRDGLCGAWTGPEFTADETVHLTVAGDWLLGHREMNAPAGFNLKTRQSLLFGFPYSPPSVQRGNDLMANGCAPVVYDGFVVSRRHDALQVFRNMSLEEHLKTKGDVYWYGIPNK